MTFVADSKPAIGEAESTDGITWTKSLSNPIMVTNTTPGWDNLGVGTPSVIKNADGTYAMWYTGINVGLTLATDLLNATSVSGIETALINDAKVAICHATSPDGIAWTKDPSPVLQNGASTDWDSWGVFAPAVIQNTDGSYDMWYTGGKGSPTAFFNFLQNSVTLNSALLNGVNVAIGHATSTNGTTWTKDTASNPVLSKGAGSAWDNGGVAFPSVVALSGFVFLWYTGVTASPAAASTSFLNGNNLTTIVAAGTGTSVKIGYAILTTVTPPVTTTTVAGPITGSGAVTVSTIVNSQGYFSNSVTLTSTDSLVNVSIGAGTVGETASGTALATISVAPVTTPPPPPPGANVIGLTYDFQPAGATFNPPISMTFNYNGITIPSGVSETNLVLAFYNTATGQWVTLPSVVNPFTHTITAQVAHFTNFSVMNIPASTTTTTTTPTTTTTTIFTTATSTTTPTTTSTTTQTTPVITTPTTTKTTTPIVTTPPSVTTTTTTTSTPSWLWPLIIGVIVLLVIIGVGIWMWRRRKAKKS